MMLSLLNYPRFALFQDRFSLALGVKFRYNILSQPN
jgi:hypothetical protein